MILLLEASVRLPSPELPKMRTAWGIIVLSPMGKRRSIFPLRTPVYSGTGQPKPRNSTLSSPISSSEWGSDGGRIAPIGMPIAAITAFLRRAWPPDRAVIFW